MTGTRPSRRVARATRRKAAIKVEALLVYTVVTMTVAVGAVERDKRTNATWTMEVVLTSNGTGIVVAGSPRGAVEVEGAEAEAGLGAGIRLEAIEVTPTTAIPSTLGIIQIHGITVPLLPLIIIRVCICTNIYIFVARREKSNLFLIQI